MPSHDSVRLEVLLTPAEIATLPARDLRRSACVVFDVVRATSTMLEALANGAESVRPVAEIAEALAWKRRDPDALLAGEREGVRITAAVSGGTEFDLGNSPREFGPERVGGRRIVMTTSNGTRALNACSGALATLAASLGNLSATARWLVQQQAAEVLLIGAGTLEHSAWEDALGVGALVDRIIPSFESGWIDDAARVVQAVFRSRQHDLPQALGEGRNGRRLLSLPDLAADVSLCAQVDRFDFVAARDRDGALRRGRYQSPKAPSSPQRLEAR